MVKITQEVEPYYKLIDFRLAARILATHTALKPQIELYIEV